VNGVLCQVTASEDEDRWQCSEAEPSRLVMLVRQTAVMSATRVDVSVLGVACLVCWSACANLLVLQSTPLSFLWAAAVVCLALVSGSRARRV
jgi:hypothetical protein